VSVATANRLATKLGLSGYPAFKALLRSDLEEALRPSSVSIDGVRLGGYARATPWARSLEADVRRIQSATAPGGDSAFASACNRLAKARRVFVAGFGSSAFLAQYAAYNFSTLRPGCEAVTDSSGLEGASRRLLDASLDDVALQLAFARYSEAGTRVAKQFVDQGVPILAITDSTASPAASLAQLCFVVEKKSGFILSGGGAGAVALVEALIHGTASAIGLDKVESRACDLTALLGPAVGSDVPPERSS
jgi:DNA-binding MurR/RpiR family transcriptional regulator